MMKNNPKRDLGKYSDLRKDFLRFFNISETHEGLTKQLELAQLGTLGRTQVADLLEKLQRGEFSDNELYTVLHILGESGYMEASSVVQSFLQHPNPELRSIALNVIFLHWSSENPTIRATHAQECQGMFIGDPDEDVRRMAATCLGVCYEGSNDPNVGRLLAECVCDKSLDKYLRQAAYGAILSIIGKTSGDRNKFPDDVNWQLVSRFQKSE